MTSQLVTSLPLGNFALALKNGGEFTVTRSQTLKIDPRGRLVMLRCAAIVALDKIMGRFNVRKPLREATEFLASIAF